MHPEIGLRAFNQWMELHIQPEIDRRKEDGVIGDDFNLRKAQILFCPKEKRTIIRLNDEVQAVAHGEYIDGFAPKNGEIIYDNQIKKITNISLIEEEHLDCGHVTMVRINDEWHMVFDFRYNKQFASQHIDQAKEFLEGARFSKEKGNLSPCVDNLFSAAELTAKARLLLMPDEKFKEKSGHGSIHSRFNQFANLGNIEAKHREAFNRLSLERSKVRYLKGECSIQPDELDQLFNDIQDMINVTEKLIDFTDYSDAITDLEEDDSTPPR